MKHYYTIKNGKLVPFEMDAKPFLSIILVVLMIAGSGLGAYMFAKDKYAIPSDQVLLSKKDFVHYQDVEKAFARSLEKSVHAREYVLDAEELEEVFNHVFPEYKLKPEVKQQYLDSVATWSAHFSMPPLLVLSIIWRESSFNAETLSSANARGPMQVIYIYHKEKLDRINKKENDLHDIDTGIRIGVEVLREYFDRYDRNIFRAMQAYVGGMHKTYAKDILTRYFNARVYIEEQL